MNLIFQMSRSKLKSGSELRAKSSPMRQHIYFINFISSRSDLMEEKKKLLIHPREGFSREQFESGLNEIEVISPYISRVQRFHLGNDVEYIEHTSLKRTSSRSWARWRENISQFICFLGWFFPRTCSRIVSNSSRRCSRAKDESEKILKKLHSTHKVEMQRHFSLRQSSIKTHGESGVDTCKKSKRCSVGIGSNCRNDSRLLARFLSCHSLDFAFAATTTNDGDLDLTV